MLESKRTFVAESLTGTAVWDPRFITGEGEKRMHDAPPPCFHAKGGSFFNSSVLAVLAALYLHNNALFELLLFKL